MDRDAGMKINWRCVGDVDRGTCVRRKSLHGGVEGRLVSFTKLARLDCFAKVLGFSLLNVIIPSVCAAAPEFHAAIIGHGHDGAFPNLPPAAPALSSPPSDAVPSLVAPIPSAPLAAAPPAAELVRLCESRFSARDQRTRMTITNRNKEGKEKKGIYRRYTKNFDGNDQLLQKMILFAEYPPDSKGLAFMRWEYAAAIEKTPDQWLYSPSLGNVRRISVRDLGESFLGSTLTLEDIGVRHPGQDALRLIEIKPEGLSEMAWLEFIPKGESQYSKRLVKYRRDGATWESCVPAQIDYFDKKGLLQKRQELTWQNVDGTPVWKRVTVTNTQTSNSSVFEIDEVRFDVSLSDDLFSERALRRGDR